MANLGYVNGTGDNSYVACIIAPTPELGQSQTDFKSPLLRVLKFDDSLPTGGVKLTVPEGAIQLVGSLRDAAGMIPDGVTVTVTTPTGTVLNQATAPNASGQVVLMANGSLTDLVIDNPAAGQWTIQVVAPTTSDEFQFFISTVPTADVQDTVQTTLESMLHTNAKTILGPEFAETWKCTICKWGCYALAGAISLLVAGGLAYITAGAAPIVALASFLGIAATAVATSIIAVINILTFGTRSVVEQICNWANACPAPATQTPSWSGNQQVPGTQMSDSPAAVVFNNKLYCFYQGTGNNAQQLRYNVLQSDGHTWAGDQQVPSIQISNGPAAVVFNGNLYCFYQGYSAGATQLHCTVLSAGGTSWSADQWVRNTSMTAGPSAVVFNQQLYCFYQDRDDGSLRYMVLSANGTWSSGNVTVANTLLSASPSAVVFNGRLYCFHQGATNTNNGQLRYNVLSADGTTWAGDQQVPATNMSASPSAVVFNNQIYCFYHGQNDNGQLHYNVLSPAGTWIGDRQISIALISHGPSAVVFESLVFSGRIYCFHQGQNNNGQLWYDFT
jgi:hypothetical protein